MTSKATRAEGSTPCVDDELAQRGFVPAGRPPFGRPELSPETMGAMTNAELGAAYAAGNAWAAYTRETLAQIEARLVAVRGERALAIASLRKSLRSRFKGLPGQELDDEIATDPRVVELTNEETFLHALRIRVEALSANVDADLKFISRSVELRRQDLELHLTESGMALRRPLLPAPIGSGDPRRRP